MRRRRRRQRRMEDGPELASSGVLMLCDSCREFGEHLKEFKRVGFRSFGPPLAAAFTSPAHRPVRRIASARSSTTQVVVDFPTREFLAVRDKNGRWSESSFQPWARGTRQWVFESPLIRHGSLVEPAWRVSDMDGLLDGNAFWKHGTAAA